MVDSTPNESLASSSEPGAAGQFPTFDRAAVGSERPTSQVVKHLVELRLIVARARARHGDTARVEVTVSLGQSPSKLLSEVQFCSRTSEHWKERYKKAKEGEPQGEGRPDPVEA